MIWISTLCLLAIASWLFFNALNERRWVAAHSHDETVASDEGLLPNFTSVTKSALPEGSGKLSIGQEDGLFASAVAKVQEKATQYGDRVFESKVAAARIDDPDQRPTSASQENTVFGRMVAKVSAKTDAMDARLDGKIKAAGSLAASTVSSAVSSGESFYDRASSKVAATSDELTTRVASMARNRAAGVGDAGTDDESVFGKVVTKVSSQLESMDRKAEQRRAARAEGDGKTDEDLLTRVSDKVGARINEIESKIVKKGTEKTDT